MQEPSHSGHTVAVIGGAVAGSTLALELAEAGAHVVVFEQNDRPYGKIEDGLPRWHVALRRKEFAAIDAKLKHERIHYVPQTRIGRDVALADLLSIWKFNAIVLACGAWRDRALPIAPPIELSGLLYQNPFIYWFNHHDDANYAGPHYDVADGALVIGGGLASIDVAKALVFVTVRDALRERRIDVSFEDMEHQGIPKLLAEEKLTFEDLNLRGSTLLYRRRLEDMPLTELPPDLTPDKFTKALEVRRRIVTRAMEKYCFSVEPLHEPIAVLNDGQQVKGLRCRTPSAPEKDLPADLVVSSIGSLPESIPGLAMQGELLAYSNFEEGRLAGHPELFAVGNVVTGRGNILASRRHSLAVAANVASYLNTVQARDSKALQEMHALLKQRQAAVGYSGSYEAWITSHPPT